jgi:hypothetical protein
MAKKKTADLAVKLSEGEQDLLSELEHGYQLEGAGSSVYRP